MANKVKYIGTATTLTVITIFLWFFLSDHFETSTSPDITCSGNCINPEDSDCIGYFTVKAKYKTWYFYNKDNLTIDFGQNVRSFDLGINDGRFKDGYRPFDFQKSFYRDYKYVLKLYKNKPRTFRVRVCKLNPAQDIKWGFKAMNVDPFFRGINISIDNHKSCERDMFFYDKTIIDYGFVTRERKTYGWVWSKINQTNEWKVNGTENYKNWEVTGKHLETFNYTKCIRDTSYFNLNFGEKTLLLNYSKCNFKCINTKKSIGCKSCEFGDCKTKKLYSGELYLIANATHFIYNDWGSETNCVNYTIKGITIKKCIGSFPGKRCMKFE